uniref:Uncharacterized protein n=1 Tax=Ciona intestinalis TaxID=7719 RepID=H2XMS5_CIOIN
MFVSSATSLSSSTVVVSVTSLFAESSVIATGISLSSSLSFNDGIRGAVMRNFPASFKVDVNSSAFTLSGNTMDRWYSLREYDKQPSFSSFDSFFASTTTFCPIVFTLTSLGSNPVKS